MKNKTRFIPLVIIGAILLSLLAIVPAFGADEVGFIDPGDIEDDPSGTLSDSTPDDQEWARQGGRIGLMLSDDGLDTPVKRVLIPSIDATMSGNGDVDAHMDTISNASVSGISWGRLYPDRYEHGPSRSSRSRQPTETPRSLWTRRSLRACQVRASIASTTP